MLQLRLNAAKINKLIKKNFCVVQHFWVSHLRRETTLAIYALGVWVAFLNSVFNSSVSTVTCLLLRNRPNVFHSKETNLVIHIRCWRRTLVFNFVSVLLRLEALFTVPCLCWVDRELGKEQSISKGAWSFMRLHPIYLSCYWLSPLSRSLDLKHVRPLTRVRPALCPASSLFVLVSIITLSHCTIRMFWLPLYVCLPLCWVSSSSSGSHVHMYTPGLGHWPRKWKCKSLSLVQLFAAPCTI